MSSVSEHQKTVKYKSDTANICPFLSSLTFYWPIHGPIGPRFKAFPYIYIFFFADHIIALDY